MREMKIIGKDIQSVEELHEKFCQELDLPNYYGANLDALYDVLTEAREETYIEMIFDDMEDSEMKVYLEKVWRVLCDAADENENLEIEKVEEIDIQD